MVPYAYIFAVRQCFFFNFKIPYRENNLMTSQPILFQILMNAHQGLMDVNIYVRTHQGLIPVTAGMVIN